MTVLEGWEHGNSPGNEGYVGDTNTNYFDASSRYAYDGTYSLRAEGASAFENILYDGSGRTIQLGDTVEFWYRPSTTTTNYQYDKVYFLATTGSTNTQVQGYSATLQVYNSTFALDRMDDEESGGTELASDSSATFTAGAWHQIEIVLGSNGDASATMYDTDGNALSNTLQVSLRDYTSGKYGFSTYDEPAWHDYTRRNPDSGGPPEAPTNLTLSLGTGVST